jgi:hypothetical protein
MVRSLALDGLKMAQGVLGGQGFLEDGPCLDLNAGGRGLRVRSGVASARDGDLVGPLPGSG